MAGQSRRRLIWVEVGPVLVAPPDNFLAPCLPVIPDLGRFVDQAVRRYLYQSNLFATAGPLVNLPQIAGEFQSRIFGLKGLFQEGLALDGAFFQPHAGKGPPFLHRPVIPLVGRAHRS